MTKDKMINSDSEGQRGLTSMLNKDVSFHKARVAPEKQYRNATKKAFEWIWAELTYDPPMYLIKKKKKSLFQHVSEKIHPTARQVSHFWASKPGLKEFVNMLKTTEKCNNIKA